MGGGVNHSLAYTPKMTALDPAMLPQTFATLWSQLIWLRIIYGVDLGYEHSNSSALYNFLVDTEDRYEAFKEYCPRERVDYPVSARTREDDRVGGSY